MPAVAEALRSAARQRRWPDDTSAQPRTDPRQHLAGRPALDTAPQLRYPARPWSRPSAPPRQDNAMLQRAPQAWGQPWQATPAAPASHTRLRWHGIAPTPGWAVRTLPVPVHQPPTQVRETPFPSPTIGQTSARSLEPAVPPRVSEASRWRG